MVMRGGNSGANDAGIVPEAKRQRVWPVA